MCHIIFKTLCELMFCGFVDLRGCSPDRLGLYRKYVYESRLMRSLCCLLSPLSSGICIVYVYVYVSPIITAHSINPFHQSLHPTVARQRKYEKMHRCYKYTSCTKRNVGRVFSMRSVSYQKKVGDQFFPNMILSPVGLRPETDNAGVAEQQQ
jgi:hypothetical protein